MLQHDGSAMRRNFDNVIGGVGVRFGEKGCDHFVDALASGWFDQLAEEGASGGQIVTDAQHGLRNGSCLAPGYADDANTATAGWCCNSDNGVSKFHSLVCGMSTGFCKSRA